MKARTIAEVVAGEMSYKGTPQQQWADALGIASTISNRATAYGVSPQAIVTAPGQYQAYGKNLPKGVGRKEIARAEQALRTVAENGPVTAATHYALPSHTKNIKGWSSFKQLDSVPGSHVYAIDPDMQPIVTTQGVVQAQPNAFETVINNAKVGALKVARTVASVPQAAAAMVQNGFNPQANEQAMADAAQQQTSGTVAGLYEGALSFAHPDQTGISSSLRNSLLGTSAELGKTLGITSGYRSPAHNLQVGGARHSQHVRGQAADIDMSGMSDEERARTVTELAQRGVTRFGTYSNHPNMLHVDLGQPPAGQAAHFMHNKSAANIASAPGWFQNLAGSVINQGAFPTPQAGPIPTDAPRPPAIPEDPRAAALRSLPPAPTPTGVLSTGLDTLAPQQPTTGPLVNPVAAQATPEQIGLSRAMTAGMDSPAYISRNIPPARPQQGPPAPRPQQGPPMPAAVSAAPTGPAAGAPGPPVVGGSPPLVGGAPKQGRVGTGPFTQAPPQAAPQRFGPTTAPAPTRSIASAPAGIASTPMQQQAPGQFTLGNATMTPSVAEAVRAGPAAIPPDPGQVGRLSLPPAETQPSLAEVAEQSAPTLAEPTVVADQPVKEVVQTVKTTKPAPTIGPVQTVAPAAPRQIGGLLGTVRDLAMATPYGRMARSLAGLAGSVPNPKSFDYGTGAQAIGDALSGATQSKPGAVSYSKSTPGYSIKSLGNGMIEKTNQYGAKSYEHVGMPGSGIFSGQPQPGGLLGGFGLSGLPDAVGGFFSGGGRTGFGNTANVGPNAMGFAGPWGAGTATGLGGIMSNIGQGIGNILGGSGGGGGRGWGNTANVGPSAMGYAGPWGGGGASSSGSATGGAGGGSSANKGGKKK